jgi:hypothetical protein
MLEKMDPGEFMPNQQIRCDGCRQSAPGYDIVNYGSIERGYRRLCSRCYNGEAAKAAGLEDSNMPVRAGGLADCAGGSRLSFSHPCSGWVALDAFEVRAGCRLAIISDHR